LYNSETVIAGLFREVIAPGAFTASVKSDDVRALFNHNPDHILGRKSVGTLKLSEDAKGLRYTIDINLDDPAATAVAARVARRDVSGSSFGFAIDNPATDEEWTPPATHGGVPLRTLKRLRLVDVSPVAFPAYAETTVAVREINADAIAWRELVRIRIELEKARMRA